MQFQEFDNLIPVTQEFPVVAFGHNIHDFPGRGQLICNHSGRQFDHHERRSFERLDKARGHAYGNTIPVPEFPPMAGLKPDLARLYAVCSLVSGDFLYIGSQLSGSLIVRDMGTRVDVAGSAARRQPDIPDPARRLCGRMRAGLDGLVFVRVWHLCGQRSVVEQVRLL